jgi:hypothetical protein
MRNQNTEQKRESEIKYSDRYEIPQPMAGQIMV